MSELWRRSALLVTLVAALAVTAVGCGDISVPPDDSEGPSTGGGGGATPGGAPCEIDCEGKQCGSDGCGGDCGTCANTQQCDPAGKCCTPNCERPDGTQRDCGDNGCGGNCGTCPGQLVCQLQKGLCVPP